MIDAHSGLSVTKLFPAGSRAAGSFTGDYVDIKDYVGTPTAIFNVGTPTGTPTATVDLYLESTGSVAVAPTRLVGYGTLARITGGDTFGRLAVPIERFSRYLRVAGTISSGGNVPLSVSLAGIKQWTTL